MDFPCYNFAHHSAIVKCKKQKVPPEAYLLLA